MKRWIWIVGLCIFATLLIWLAPQPETGCTIGDVYFVTDAPAGQQWFMCAGVNTWTVVYEEAK